MGHVWHFSTGYKLVKFVAESLVVNWIKIQSCNNRKRRQGHFGYIFYCVDWHLRSYSVNKTWFSFTINGAYNLPRHQKCRGSFFYSFKALISPLLIFLSYRDNEINIEMIALCYLFWLSCFRAQVGKVLMKAWKPLNHKLLFKALECVLSASMLSGKRKQYYCHPYSFLRFPYWSLVCCLFWPCISHKLDMRFYVHSNTRFICYGR